MTAAQTRIAQTIELFYDENNPIGPRGSEYKRVVDKLDDEAKTSFVIIITIIKNNRNKGKKPPKNTFINHYNYYYHILLVQDEVFRTTVLEPFGRFCSYFPEVNEAIKRRQKKLLDYDTQRSKVRKLIDKPSEDPQKLPLVSIFFLKKNKTSIK